MSDYSCVYVDYVKGPECFTDSIRKARKEHKCCECGDAIKRGDKYEETTGIWDGKPNRYRTCLDCLSVRNAFFCDGWFYTFVWENLYEHLRDCAHTTPTEALAKLTPDARASVCEFIEELWDEDD